MLDLLVEGIETRSKNVQDVVVHGFGVVLAGSKSVDTAFEFFKTLMQGVRGGREMVKINHSGFVGLGWCFGGRGRRSRGCCGVVVSKSRKLVGCFVSFKLSRFLDRMFVSSGRWHDCVCEEGKGGNTIENVLLITC